MAWCVDLQIARVLDAILPGTGLHGSLLTKASAAGTDFAKACACRSQTFELFPVLQFAIVTAALTCC